MHSIADALPVVNPPAEIQAIQGYLRASVRGLSARGAASFRRVALADMAAKGTASMYWRCAASDERPDDAVRQAAAALQAGGAA